MEVQKKQYLSKKFKKNIRKRDRGKLEKYLSEADDEAFEELDKIELSSMTATTLLSVFLGGVSAGRFYLKDYAPAIFKTVISLIFYSLGCFFIISGIKMFWGDDSLIQTFNKFAFGSNLGIVLINIFLLGWYVSDIFACREQCSERNLTLIAACVNADIAKKHLDKYKQCPSDKAEIIEKSKKLCSKKFDLAAKYLNERYWELIKPQLNVANENTLNNLNAIHYKNKTTAAILSIFLGGVGAGRFYAGKYPFAIFKLIISVVLCVFSVVLNIAITDFDPSLLIISAITSSATLIVLFIFYFEDFFNGREKLYRR